MNWSLTGWWCNSHISAPTWKNTATTLQSSQIPWQTPTTIKKKRWNDHWQSGLFTGIILYTDFGSSVSQTSVAFYYACSNMYKCTQLCGNQSAHWSMASSGSWLVKQLVASEVSEPIKLHTAQQPAGFKLGFTFNLRNQWNRSLFSSWPLSGMETLCHSKQQQYTSSRGEGPQRISRPTNLYQIKAVRFSGFTVVWSWLLQPAPPHCSVCTWRDKWGFLSWNGSSFKALWFSTLFVIPPSREKRLL